MDLVIQFGGAFENHFHFPDNGQGTQRLGAGQLTQIHAQIVMADGMLGITGQQPPANVDALQGELFAGIIVFGEFRQIKAGFPVVPDSLVVFGVSHESFPGSLIGLFRP